MRWIVLVMIGLLAIGSAAAVPAIAGSADASAFELACHPHCYSTVSSGDDSDSAGSISASGG